MRGKRLLLLGLAVLAIAGGALAFATVGSSSEPASQDVTVPSAGSSTSVSWTGTIPPNSNPTSDCSQATGTVLNDSHGITVHVPSAGYSGLKTKFTFQISWTPANPTGDETLNDEILTVMSDNGDEADQTETREIGVSDTGSTKESVVAINLPPGNYTVFACGFVNSVPQPYTGTLTVSSVTLKSTILKSSSAQGLAFSAAVPADPQRDEAEPLITSDKAGLLYTCGPTGFSNAADYAQVSTDGGDQFHLMGTGPRGQQTIGGGGDCVVASGELPNAQGNYQYAYAGLGALSGFSTATSPDNGHTLTPAGVDTAGGVTSNGALADRQWMTFTDAGTVLLTYNQQQPRNAVVIKSTDGGLTYGAGSAIAAPDPDFPGPMHWIPSLHTVVMPWTKGEQVNLAISQDGGDTWTDCVVAKGDTVAGGTAGFATADVDSAGNVYVAWADSADYHTWLASLHAADVAKCNQSIADVENTPDGEPTVQPGFTAPVQMDRDAVSTTVFPWVAAGGTPGRAAVAFYGTPQDGDPNTSGFRGAWDVYVSQTTDAFDAVPKVGQVKATTHPFHYDSICLNGLGCDTTEPGDRSLADFFAITYNQKDGRLSVVYDRGNKQPDDSSGYVATPMVATQIAGPSNGGGTAGFATDDVDSAGNVYVAWADKTNYHVWMASVTADQLTHCNQAPYSDLSVPGGSSTQGDGSVAGTADGIPSVTVGSTPVQVDRDEVKTTVFPWIAAGGSPGRVAVAFYGTDQDGDPNTSAFKAAWNVYVNQSLNALAGAGAQFSQVKATTHPFHYDSICLNGLGCDISGGDRSLADFFAITYNRQNGKLSVVFDRGNKKP
ncbi:MAG TPA: hypothetical protein VFL58_11555, partial [Gaiellaceae bacterium]|nr:hypothetical protein [Gaiellaceae bacterium]